MSVTNKSGWGDFFTETLQGGIKTAIDYNVADQARDNHLSTPEGNMFHALPSTNPQSIAPNHTGNGTPLKQVFYRQDGTLNVAMVGGAVLLAVLIFRGR